MPCSPLFYVANVSFNAIRENKILAKISEFTVVAFTLIYTWPWQMEVNEKVHQCIDCRVVLYSVIF